MKRKPNKTHCKRNHQFTPENTYLYKGRRNCRECSNLRNRNYRAKQSLAKYGPEGYSHKGNLYSLGKNQGEDHVNHKLTEEEVMEIRATYAGGSVSQRLLADQYHVSQVTIHSIVNHKTWTHL